MRFSDIRILAKPIHPTGSRVLRSPDSPIGRQQSSPKVPAHIPGAAPRTNLIPTNLEFKNVNQSQSVTVFEGAVRFKNTDAVEDYSAHVKTPVVKVA